MRISSIQNTPSFKAVTSRAKNNYLYTKNIKPESKRYEKFMKFCEKHKYDEFNIDYSSSLGMYIITTDAGQRPFYGPHMHPSDNIYHLGKIIDELEE